VVDLAKLRDLQMAERALAGDLESAIRWLAKYGGEHYRQAERKRQQTGKCEGRKGYAETEPALVEAARNTRRSGLTLEQVAITLQG
jgi:hypothetical protein